MIYLKDGFAQWNVVKKNLPLSLPIYLVYLFTLASCSAPKKAVVTAPTGIPAIAKTAILDKTEFKAAHAGISIYDPQEKKFLFSYQDDKYFTPASNTKIFTCFTALKHLKDSIVALEYIKEGDEYTVRFTGDPTFLHPDFKEQPAYNFLLKNAPAITFINPKWKAQPFGNGWAWNDYDGDYAPERAPMPIYGNLVEFSKKGNAIKVIPKAFKDSLTTFSDISDGKFDITRNWKTNQFEVVQSNQKFTNTYIPFTHEKEWEVLSIPLLEDTLNRVLHVASSLDKERTDWKKLYSQATDTLLSLMMHRSDNFYAEQTLLMSGYQMHGWLDDARTIDTLLKSDLVDIPDRPRWVDGSGLSRYNMMTPRSFVWLLQQIQQTAGWERVKAIFPSGNEGTLAGLYKNYNGKIFAKTGTLSNTVALSGFIFTNSGKPLIFSVMVNAHQTSAGNIRRAIETFLTGIIDSQ
jgi:serine-type D-Ala-D-Ala carboxypeptidase/endopeptidase (penicillin-binding protein 4)